MDFTAVIQARMGSTRLPNKVLMKINGITVIECLLEQISHSKLLTNKIIATTTTTDDDKIILIAKSLGINVFRGSQTDVLDRYYQCAKQFSIKNIVRISGDAPLIDPTIMDRTINLYEKSKFDYVNNFSTNRFPIGTEVEVFSFSTLEKVWQNAVKPSEREHVTSYIYTNPDKFSIGHLNNVSDLSNLHWTVDRKEDLEFVRAIYKNINRKPILLEDILKLLDDQPSLLEINKEIDPREGYKKSLLDDLNSATK
jgi:spore coat polysaccharide biosynthesis protein SpsF